MVVKMFCILVMLMHELDYFKKTVTEKKIILYYKAKPVITAVSKILYVIYAMVQSPICVI